MPCPMCGEPMEEMCEECGVFFEKQELIITDCLVLADDTCRCMDNGPLLKSTLACVSMRASSIGPNFSITMSGCAVPQQKTNPLQTTR